MCSQDITQRCCMILKTSTRDFILVQHNVESSLFRIELFWYEDLLKTNLKIEIILFIGVSNLITGLQKKSILEGILNRIYLKLKHLDNFSNLSNIFGFLVDLWRPEWNIINEKLKKVKGVMWDILSNYSFKNCTCGLHKLFCVRRDQAKLLVYGPTDPILSKNRKNNITKFWPTDFFLIYYFLLYFFI